MDCDKVIITVVEPCGEVTITVNECFSPVGSDGKSAYQVAVDNGFIGTESEWLESLVSESKNLNEYADISEMLADQENQNQNNINLVLDASDDYNISFSIEDDKQAVYVYTGYSNANIDDYKLISTPYGVENIIKTATGVPKAAVIFQFDDSIDSHYKYLFPLFQSKGIVGSLATIPELIDEADYLTHSQLMEMYNAGWEILGHGEPTLTSFITEDAIRAEIVRNFEGIVDLGIPRGDIKNYVYPSHFQNSLVRRIISDYYKSARGQIPTQKLCNDPLYLYEMHSYHIKNMSVSEITAAIDKGIDENRLILLYAHKTEADFTDNILSPVVDYIQASGIDIVTTDEGVNRFGKGITSGDGFAASNRGARIRLDVNDIIRQGDYNLGGSRLDSIGNPTSTMWGAGAGDGNYNDITAIGSSAAETSSGRKTAVGYRSARESTGSQTSVGYQAGFKSVGDLSTQIGEQAGENNTGNNQSALGYQAGYNNTGVNQTAIGSQSGRTNTGANQTALGYQAGYNNIGSLQLAIGLGAGYGNKGSKQIAIGADSGKNNTGSDQTAIGSLAGYKNTGNRQVTFGYESGRDNNGNNTVAIGYGAGKANIIDNRFIVEHSISSAIPLIDADFQYGGIAIGSPSATNKLSDERLESNRFTFYLDEAADKLHVRVKYADGTTLKTGEISLI